MKTKFRILGIDDSPFSRDEKFSLLIGVVMRADFYIDGFISTTIHIDGSDAEDKIVDMVSSRLASGCAVIMTSGITFGGFNMIDSQRLSDKTGKPFLSFTDRDPDIEGMRAAILKYFPGSERLRILESSKTEALKLKNGAICYVNRSKINIQDARSIINKTIREGHIPEPLRMAHLIGRLIKYGYSGKFIPDT